MDNLIKLQRIFQTFSDISSERVDVVSQMVKSKKGILSKFPGKEKELNEFVEELLTETQTLNKEVVVLINALVENEPIIDKYEEAPTLAEVWAGDAFEDVSGMNALVKYQAKFRENTKNIKVNMEKRLSVKEKEESG